MLDFFTAKLIGILIGLMFGLITIFVGIWEAIIVLMCIFLGWFLTKFWAGEIDFIDWYEGFLRKRGKRD